MTKILFIVGPTASGKSALALACARRVGSEVISCDSMQIYRHMDIGTAKTAAQEADGVPIALTDIADPKSEFSAFEYAEAAVSEIDRLASCGRLPIFAGGTGLYAHSVIYPFSFGAEKNERVREELERELRERGAEALHAELAAADPKDAAKIHPNNVKRLLRALEILRTTGAVKPSGENAEMRYSVKMIFLLPPRDKLYEAIDRRVETMFELGLEDEVRSLVYDRGVDFKSQSMQAIGYREFADYFSGEIGMNELKDRIKRDTRRYAKRQITWFSRYKFAVTLDPCSESLESMTDIALSDAGYTENRSQS